MSINQCARTWVQPPTLKIQVCNQVIGSIEEDIGHTYYDRGIIFHIGKRTQSLRTSELGDKLFCGNDSLFDNCRDNALYIECKYHKAPKHFLHIKIRLIMHQVYP